jgi:hypothetical protein
MTCLSATVQPKILRPDLVQFQIAGHMQDVRSIRTSGARIQGCLERGKRTDCDLLTALSAYRSVVSQHKLVNRHHDLYVT